ncbi:MAG TPA: bifunctional aldolase/short-chain dehydrogenase [Verrucomicrobiales bacterium]|jgi:rhamnose utilization protein RhaD (predicted bifunctional aldolase and dehydrogenase)/NAD(P)-dependent dehydrogenase (short-subunit alcohol dehydrogenase family)|nr:bifunctional aldolase/short-chain dehydrogenase [Verrucomicrobiales bacterium]
MQSLWTDSEASAFSGDDLSLRVYTSRLLGREPQLVLHGGGNTSVKSTVKDFFGEPKDILYIKGSGGDLATIEASGFPAVKMSVLLKMADLPSLSDADMVREQRAAMLDPDSPNPSIEAVVHAVIPHKFVDHTHSNAVIAVTNQPDGLDLVRSTWGDRVIIVPYVMPGFVLGKAVRDLTKNADWSKVEGLILMQHGIFTFGKTAKESYERMIKLVSEAEAALEKRGGGHSAAKTASFTPDNASLRTLAKFRQAVSKARGRACFALPDFSEAAAGFASRPDVASLATRGTLTPDHSIRTKRMPAILDGDNAVADFAAAYASYFQKNQSGQTMLDPAPRWAVLPGQGVVSFGASLTEARIVQDIAGHTLRTIQQAEAAGGWVALPEKDLFEIEYWDLEQAKLRKAPAPKPLQGKVAIVTGAAAGIGRAIALALQAQGAAVVGMDLNPETPQRLAGHDGLTGKVINLTDYPKVQAAVEEVVATYGGLDILVSNAGIFTAGANFEDMDPVNWAKSMEVNLTSHMRLLQSCVPFLKLGIDPTAIFVGSRNVKAPGAGAGSYSCAKAAVTQLVRVAALELAPAGVRVNIIHPDAVFDTELWTPEALARSAQRYGVTVEEYKTRNLMKTEIKSADVAGMVCGMAGPLFAKTTGAQIPVDGGNDRVI